MTVLEIRFPTGRYHATPWGRHVNEGAVEWPPSPWRILRALIATWHLKAWEIPNATILALVEALCLPPAFHLPRFTASHTRHFMPNDKNYKVMVFDTFFHFAEKDSMLAAWDVVLPNDQLVALRTIAQRLSYLGRAESLVEMRLVEGIKAIDFNAMPLAGAAPQPWGFNIVHLLVPMLPAEYRSWRELFLEEQKLMNNSKRQRKREANKSPGVPLDIFSALHADTGELQAEGWSLPPGAAFVSYTRPPDIFSPSARVPHLRSQPPPTTARYALSSAVPPAITSCLAVAERVHDALCKWSDQGGGSASVFTGIGPDGRPLTGHQHLHVFCEAGGDGAAITHLTVWSPAGFDAEACLALRRLHKVWGHGGHDLHLVLHGLGQPADFGGCAILGEARVWRSLTPFVSTRHAKTFRDGRPKIDPANGWQVGSPAHDLLRLVGLAHPGLGVRLQPRRAITLGGPEGRRALRCLQFQTARHRGGGSRGQGEGASFTLEFPSAVRGPLAFGYGAHFGLGLFAPVAAPEAPEI